MKRFQIPRGGWVLVCDGAKALLLRNEGDADLPNLKLVDVAHQSHLRNRDLGTDRPGRVYQSRGGARSATDETDRHAQSEEKFVGAIANRLDRLVSEHTISSLLVVAAPKALGMLRGHLSGKVQDLITAEIRKDLVGLPTADIERRLIEAGGRG